MKAYIAGTLSTKEEREFLHKIDDLCKKYRLETFLPHRDVGLWKSYSDLKEIAKKDLQGFRNCRLLIANLNGFGVSSGTAWEIGYAYANKIFVIGIKTDRKVKDSIQEMSAILVGTTKIVTSFKNLEKEIKKLI